MESPCRGSGHRMAYLWLVGKWKNGSNSSSNCTSFLHSLLTKGKMAQCWHNQIAKKNQPFALQRSHLFATALRVLLTACGYSAAPRKICLQIELA